MPRDKRESTGSATHLIKIIAKEVFDEEMKKIDWYDLNTFLDPIKSNLEQAGVKWSKEEDQLLVDEVRVAVATIAKNHKRTTGAIIARVQDQSVINCDSLKGK